MFIVKAPSVYAHIFSGIFLLITFLIIFMNYNKLMGLSLYKFLLLSLLVSVALGVHSISHNMLETTYGFNPFTWD
jgi:hypothetical protein